MKTAKQLIFGMLILLQASCSLKPPYHTPTITVPVEYKENSLWVKATPFNKLSHNTCWWEMYQDPVLSQLQAKLTVSNQNLKVALARYENATALYALSRSALYPSIIANGSASRQKTSSTVANASTNTRYNDRLLAANFSYEIDLWGRVRNSVMASKYRMHASEEDVRAIALSLRTLLITNYFSLQAADESLAALSELRVAYQKAFDLTKNRFQEGIATQADVSQAKTQLENVKTLYTEKKLNRTTFEHAIAVLIGEPPALFSLAPSRQSSHFPTISPDLPASLLQRRPDIMSAEKAVMAANADIGVAKSAFFPNINLIGEAGFESASIANLFSMPSLIWSLGPTVMQTIFDGGNILARVKLATATYHETVAHYRQTVLDAFREVEDNLAAQNLLKEESQSQDAALYAANDALKQAFYRYEGGVVTYLDIVVSQNIALQAKLAAIDIHSRRQIASVQLIKALGGPWE